MRKIKLLAVADIPVGCTSIDFQKHICTVVVNKKQALEYIQRRYICEHTEHFKQWCSLHNTTENTAENDYIEQVVGWDELTRKYSISPIKLDKNKLAMCVRMSMYMTPVGASYESDAENILSFVNNFSKIMQAAEKNL